MEKIYHLKTKKLKNKILLIFIGIFLLNFVSAELNPFFNSKIFNKKIDLNTPEFLKSGFNPNYGTIRLSKTILGVPTDKLAEYSLTKIEESIIDNVVYGKAVLYSNGKLFDDADFENIKGINEDVNYQYFILANLSYIEQEVIGYKEVCSFLNDTYNKKTEEVCEQIPSEYKNLTKYRNEWIKYNYEELIAGNYEWKIEFKKPINKAIDFIPKARGEKLNEWVWFDSNWAKRKELKIQENNGVNFTNYSVLFNISYDSDMQVDFDDLRFVNSTNNGELGYYIENQSNSNWALVWVMIPDLAESVNTSIYMYYGNSGATSKSNGSNAFIYYEDFSTDVFLKDNWTRGNETTIYTDTDNGWLIVNDIKKAEYKPDNITNIDSIGIIIEQHTKFTNNSVGILDYHSIFYNGITYSTTLGQFGSSSNGWSFYGSVQGITAGVSTTNDKNKWIMLKTIHNSSYGTQYWKRDEDSDYTYIRKYAKSLSRLGGLQYYKYSSSSSGMVTLDWIRVRKNADTEPSYTIGDEESTSTNSCTYSGSGNWTIQGVDNCNITSNTISPNFNNILIINGTGTTTLNANISNFSIYRLQGGSLLRCLGGCIKY